MQWPKTDDPTTTREETFGESQRLRPGDIITNAVIDGRRVAIDVGITSQAKQTQGDPIQYYANSKFAKYRRTIQIKLHPMESPSEPPFGHKKDALEGAHTRS